MQLIRLRASHCKNPVGLDEAPYFSWALQSERPCVKQTSYRLVVTAQDGQIFWDSGERRTDENTFIPYEGKPLNSLTSYKWSVTAFNNYNESASAEGTFETAFTDNSEWIADWVESALPFADRESGFGNQPPATLFRKKFELESNIASARLYATARGAYIPYINGHRVDGRELAPGYASYDVIFPYQTYDVTALMRKGCNALGLYVGDGWYFNQETAMHKEEAKKGRHAVIFELHVYFTDGTKKIIVSDETVKTAYGPVIFSDLFAGERYDARKKISGWSEPDFDDAKWVLACKSEKAVVTLRSSVDDVILPVKEIPASSLFKAPNGDLIADFGQNMAGKVHIAVSLPKDYTISLEHFEALGADGNYFNTIMSTNGVGAGADQRVEFISKGEKADYSPLFTYFGFRYVRIRFFDENGKELTGDDMPSIANDDLTAIALSTKKENLGTFCCSDEGLNKLYSNIRWSQYSNMVSIPTDCPQREKAGWTGDAGIYIETALLNEDVTPFFTRWLESVKSDQQENGAVPMVVPFNETYRFMSQMMAQMTGSQGHVAPAGWGDACVKVPWKMYLVTGNKEILKSSYETMRRWCDYIITSAKACGRPDLPPEKERWLWDTGFHYGEWVIPSTSKGGFSDQEATGMAMAMTGRYIAPIFGWLSVSTLAKAAKLLGHLQDADHYGGIAAKMEDAIRTCLIGAEGEAPAEYMGAYVLLLYFDLVPKRWRAKYEARLLEMITENGGCLDTGFLATPYILETLEKTGHIDEAYNLLFQTKNPSWLYEVQHGATTIWETWNAVSESGEPQHVSMNHYSFGCVAEWMFRVIGGIGSDKPGFKHFIIAPQPDKRLSWAERSYISEQGTVSCRWERTEKGIEVSVEVPCNTTAAIKLPDGQSFETGSGKYKYISEKETEK